MEVLGVRIDNLSKKETFETVEFFLSDENFHQIATINPEFVLKAQEDKVFKEILNRCDLNVADGVGIWFSFFRFGKILRCRFPGIDLMKEILKIAHERGLKIFLAANTDGLSSWEETKNAILKIYPKLKIGGMNLNRNCPAGYELQAVSYEIVFCNFGASYQEKFLYSLKSLKNSKIKLTMGVGGSFDFLTGKQKRAPRLFGLSGTEWLWRLIHQPSRMKRIFNAVIIFPLKILINKPNK